MTSVYTLLRALFLLTSPHQTLQVDIGLQWWSEGMNYLDGLVSARWNNVSPGDCCMPTISQIPSLNNFQAGEATFYGLRHGQFGAGWAATGFAHSDIVNCNGIPILRVFGPSTEPDDSIVAYNPPWGEGEQGTPQNVVFAATWIDLRLRFPPSSADTRYLQWQGVKGAVWGSGRWSAASDGIPFPKNKRSTLTQRLNGYAQQATAYIAAPKRWKYPDVYTVNGTDYTIGDNETYRSNGGRVLTFRSRAGP